MISSPIGSALAKRALEKVHEHAPSEMLEKSQLWLIALTLVNFVLLFPVLVMCDYTLRKVFPVLAAIEDDKPPAYEAVATNEEDVESKTKSSEKGDFAVPRVQAADSFADKPVTSSFRDTFRLIRSSQLGFRALFHGISTFYLYNVAVGFVELGTNSLFGFAGIPVSMVAILGLCQLSTYWVHVVITPAGTVHRFPAFRKTLAATWRPALMLSAARLVGTFAFVHAVVPKHGAPVTVTPQLGLATTFSILSTVLLQLPAMIILVRVQASLLPENLRTIVSFDRSFGGKVQSEELGGKGYATVSDAWSTLNMPTLRRVFRLCVKIFAVNVGVYVLMGGFLLAQFLVITMIANPK